MNSNSNKVAWTLFFILIMSSSDFFLLVSAMICKDSQRQCVRNDSYCGDWNERLFIPVGNCPYRQLTAAQARQCLGDRTLVFIGDSQMHDLGVAVGLFLQGQTVHDSADVKFDKKRELIWQNCTKIGRFKSWGINNRPGDYNGFLFPKKDFSTEHPEEWKWQVQVWEIFYMIHQKCVRQVISNMMMKYNNDSMQLKKIDLAFWNHGLHDWHMWGTPPYGKKYYDAMVRPWIDMQLQLVVLSTPTVWVSMNNNCLGLMRHANMGIDLQFAMVEEGNWYVHKRLRAEKLPYWDAASVLRTPQRCNVSSDGLHVKMFVDIVRANILFNKLCDENLRWIGGAHAFVEEP